MGGVKIFGRSNQTVRVVFFTCVRPPMALTFRTRNSLQFHAYSSHFFCQQTYSALLDALLPSRMTFANTHFNGIIEIWSSALSLLVHTKHCPSRVGTIIETASVCVHCGYCVTFEANNGSQKCDDTVFGFRCAMAIYFIRHLRWMDLQEPKEAQLIYFYEIILDMK